MAADANDALRFDEDASTLFITPRVQLVVAECEVRATTGGGPGGQHVNRSATRVELRWRPAASESLRRALAPDHLDRVLARLRRRLDADGTLRIVASEHRSQRRNRDAALERLATIVRIALPDPVARKATRPTRASVERRLDTKKRRSHVKRERRRGTDD
ncbi:MAG: aminoacyl-tRNA hydrolase [Gemmatimonadaceae bacterium]|jgi:ribosome-associated protein|nr:aminoacyl-tRNA hydrolase [Gemmatimonadaceae bacterium]